jgi:ElaB/YqjD/DUF883 family membrane-anchored ribosome-binding protein
LSLEAPAGTRAISHRVSLGRTQAQTTIIGGSSMNTMADDAETKADFDAVATDLAMLKRDVAALMSQLKSGAVRGAKEAAEDTLDQLSERASRLYDKVAAQGERSAEAISRQVEEQPIASLLIAFGVGFIVSRLLSR